MALLGAPRRFEVELLEIAEEDPALRRVDTVTAQRDSGQVGIILPSAEGDLRTLQAVLRQVPYGRGSVSEPVDVDHLPESWRQVQRVFRAAPDVPGSCTRQGIFRRQGCSGIFADIKSEYGRGRPWRR